MLPAASRSHRARRAVAAVAAFLATVLTVSLGALPAAAASNEYLQLTKTVDRVENVAGDSYTFRIQVTCSEASCLDAELSDALGVFAGHELKNVELRSPDPSLTYVTEWTSDGTTSATAPTGYLGRTTIVEFLVMNDALRRAVMRHAGMGELEQLARESGMRTMYEDGILKALRGETTIEEVLRVTEDA